MVSDLIVVGERRPWTPSGICQLMSRLLLDRQVLWVDAGAFRRGWLAQETPAAPAPGRAAAAPFPLLTPEDLGVGNHPLACLVSARLLLRRILRAARHHGLRQPIVWLASPWSTPLLDADYAGPVVYQVTGEPPPADPDTAREYADREARILARADLVLVPSRSWLLRYDSERTRLLPAAVDVELFSAPAQPARDLPATGPVAGCHGDFNAGFDAALLAGIANRLPDWRFMLIGPVSTDLSGLGSIANVSLAGARSQDQLPRYLQYWDASLLLRRRDAPAGRGPGLTLLENLAVGLPVVASGASNLGGYADLVTQVGDADAAAAALRAAATEPAERRALRRRRVAGDGWDARAATVHRLLAELEVPASMGAVAGAR
jgi:glycosyltransferase involved in cell wall biosynthesis